MKMTIFAAFGAFLIVINQIGEPGHRRDRSQELDHRIGRLPRPAVRADEHPDRHADERGEREPNEDTLQGSEELDADPEVVGAVVVKRGAQQHPQLVERFEGARKVGVP